MAYTSKFSIDQTTPGTTNAVAPVPVDLFPATQNITAQDVGTSTVAGFQGQTFIIGTPTANSAATFALSGVTSVNIQLTGIWTGSLRVEASTDTGTTYVSKFSRLPGTVFAGAATVTSNAFLIAAVSGCTQIRIRSIAAWTGTATVKISESVNDHLADVLNPIRLLDSTTSTLMTIKAASTAALATDTSVVTSLNPNTPLPAGTNVVGHVVVDTGSTTTATQSTAANLNATVVGTGTLATQVTSLPALPAGSNAIGTVTAVQATAANLKMTDAATSATAAAIPTSASLVGVSDGTNLVALRQASNGLNSTAGGLLAVNNAAQFDDVTPTAITENSFGNLRISANRNLYGTIRDAAGNERGANVNASNQLSVSADAVVPGTGATNLGKAEDAAHVDGDTGVFSLGVRNDGAATTFSSANGDYTPLAVDKTGSVNVVQKAQTATLSNVSASATSLTVLAANNDRKGAQVINDSTAVLYLKLGTTASTTSYTVALSGAAAAPFSYYEIPAGYVGRIDGISASATGTIRVTEVSN